MPEYDCSLVRKSNRKLPMSDGCDFKLLAAKRLEKMNEFGEFDGSLLHDKECFCSCE